MNNYPAIFASQKHSKVSDKYQFVDTSKVIETLEESGFRIRTMSQQGKGASAKHMVRMNSTTEVGKGNSLEVVLLNSHNGTSRLSLNFGVYRFVCSNGLIVGQHFVEPVRVRHMGEGVKTAVSDALMQINEQHKIVAEQVYMLQNTEMTKEQIFKLAISALLLTYPDNKELATESNIYQIIQARRVEDMNAVAWSVFNRIQENVIRGGLKLEGMKRAMRPVRSIDRDFKINNELWNSTIEIVAA